MIHCLPHKLLSSVTRKSLASLTICLGILTVISCSQFEEDTEYDWQLPPGFPKPNVPPENPMNEAKVTLGKHLFYDANLSGNRQQACATCHEQKHAFSENKVFSTGSTGHAHRRNAQALVNIAYNKTLTWAHDGLTSIEQQLLIPMFGEEPVELGITGKDKEVLARFKTPKYQQLFDNAFPNEALSFDLIVKALASFVRSLTSLNSPFDQYAYAFDDDALSASAVKGMTLFFSEELECHHCHGGFNFTQSTSHETQQLDLRPFHNIGLYNVKNEGSYPKKDIGLGEISLRPQDNGRFRAPTLRNITVTAPYMHDGSLATLDDVIEFYAEGGRDITTGDQQGNGKVNPLKSPFIKGFDLSDEDKDDLKNFLKALTDTHFLENPKHANPWTTTRKKQNQ